MERQCFVGFSLLQLLLNPYTLAPHTQTAPPTSPIFICICRPLSSWRRFGSIIRWIVLLYHLRLSVFLLRCRISSREYGSMAYTNLRRGVHSEVGRALLESGLFCFLLPICPSRARYSKPSSRALYLASWLLWEYT